MPVAVAKFVSGSPWVHVFSSTSDPAAADGMPLRKPSTPFASPWAIMRFARDALVASFARGPIGTPFDTRISALPTPAVSTANTTSTAPLTTSTSSSSFEYAVPLKAIFVMIVASAAASAPSAPATTGPAAPNVTAVTSSPAAIAAIIAIRSAIESTERRCSSTAESTAWHLLVDAEAVVRRRVAARLRVVRLLHRQLELIHLVVELLRSSVLK